MLEPSTSARPVIAAATAATNMSFFIFVSFRIAGSLTGFAFDRDSHFGLHDTQINPTLRASLNRSSPSRKPTMSLLSTQRVAQLSHFRSRLSTRPVPQLGSKSASDPRFYWVKPLKKNLKKIFGEGHFRPLPSPRDPFRGF